MHIKSSYQILKLILHYFKTNKSTFKLILLNVSLAMKIHLNTNHATKPTFFHYKLKSQWYSHGTHMVLTWYSMVLQALNFSRAAVHNY
jgi:hypothetical protein